MVGRRLLPLLAAVLALCAADIGAALAQSRNTAKTDRKSAMQHPRQALHPALSRAARMAALYDALAKAPNADAAKLIEARIDVARLQSGSPTADLLMARARLSVEAKNTRLALELLNAIVDLAPDYMEARAQRASIYYETKDIAQALADLRVIVAKDPKHYTALTGLGVIFDEIGQDRLALEAFRRALAVDPFLDGVPDYIKKLTLKVEGRDI